MSSRMLTSCTLPSVMRMKVGIEPRRSSSVCILTAALCLRNLAQGNNAKHKSMVVESNAYRSRTLGNVSRFVGVELDRGANQHMSKVGKEPPVPAFVSVCKCGPRHGITEPHVIQLWPNRAQTSLDIAQ